MDNLQEKLSQILQDPGSMQQILSVANMISGEDSAEDAVPLLQMLTSSDVLPKMQQILSQVHQTDEKQEALLSALSPYLKPDRRVKLRRAVQIAQISRFARAAWASDGMLQKGAMNRV